MLTAIPHIPTRVHIYGHGHIRHKQTYTHVISTTQRHTLYKYYTETLTVQFYYKHIQLPNNSAVIELLCFL